MNEDELQARAEAKVVSDRVSDSRSVILGVVFALVVIVIALGVSLVIVLGKEANAVAALKHNSERSECRVEITNDTYQRYWQDVAKILDASVRRDTELATVTVKDMLAIPAIQRVVARTCPPPIADAPTTSTKGSP